MDKMLYKVLELSYAGRVPLVVASEWKRADRLRMIVGHRAEVVCVREEMRGIQYDMVLLDKDVLETIDEEGLAWLNRVYSAIIS